MGGRQVPQGGLALTALHANGQPVAPGGAQRTAGRRGVVGPGERRQRVLLPVVPAFGHLEERDSDVRVGRGVDDSLKPVVGRGCGRRMEDGARHMLRHIRSIEVHRFFSVFFFFP